MVAVHDVFSDHKLDVLALTETWHEKSSDTCLAAIIPPGGSIVEQARPVSRKAGTSDSLVNHSGIVCLARSGITMTKINLPHKPVIYEVLCVRLRSGNSTSTTVLSIIYRPRSKSPNAKFFSELSEHLHSLTTYSCPVYMTGNFNIPVNDSSDKFTIERKELFETLTLLQTVNDSTHRLGNTLDLLVGASDLDILDLFITDVAVSDHHILSCFINLSKVSPTFITRTLRNWRDFDIATFLQTFHTVPCSRRHVKPRMTSSICSVTTPCSLIIRPHSAYRRLAQQRYE